MPTRRFSLEHRRLHFGCVADAKSARTASTQRNHRHADNNEKTYQLSVDCLRCGIAFTGQYFNTLQGRDTDQRGVLFTPIHIQAQRKIARSATAVAITDALKIMKPVAIFRHNPTEGPGYFATFLEAHSIPFEVIAIDCGNPVPTSVDVFSGLCFMGGPMSVNDPLAWIAEECALIRLAIEHNIPVIGHCLGGQLMSKALGGTITQNPVKEIGWGVALAENSEIAHHWLGNTLGNVSNAATIFQWHGETFSLPQGATRILTNDFCTNQMFALGLHLGMQCHVEMTKEMIAEWSKSWASEIAGMSALPDSVQTPEQIQAQTSARLTGMRQLADQLYTVWIGGLSRQA